MHTISRQRGARMPPGLWRVAGFGLGRLLVGAVAHAFEILLIFQERASQRRALAELDDRMLRDIGLNRVDVALETSKPFWRA